MYSDAQRRGRKARIDTQKALLLTALVRCTALLSDWQHIDDPEIRKAIAEARNAIAAAERK